MSCHEKKKKNRVTLQKAIVDKKKGHVSRFFTMFWIFQVVEMCCDGYFFIF